MKLCKGIVIGVFATAVALVATSALAGTGIGAVFNLGKANSVNATSSLTGTSSTSLLSVSNTGTGSALQATVKTGVAPLKVNSTTQVANLNASLLGGRASTYFLPTTGTAANSSMLGGSPAATYYRLRTGPGGITISTPDTSPGFGDDYTSTTIGRDGLALISVYSENGLWVFHCSDPACSAANTISPIDSSGDAGTYTSIIIGADGLGLISYYDVANGDLKVAHCSNATCLGATITTLDSAGDVGQYTSITIGSDGLGLISYYDATNGDLKVAHCSNATCSSSTNAAVDGGAGDVGKYTSITSDPDGLALISYQDVTNGHLKVAHCTSVACSGVTTYTVDNAFGTGRDTSIAIGADGLGLISYYNPTGGVLYVAHCSDVFCSASTTAGAGSDCCSLGQYTSVTIGADGLGLISYYNSTAHGLSVAHCWNVTCSRSTSTQVDIGGNAADVGLHTSVTIGADGLPLISYYDATNKRLKVAHCSNVFCTPYLRRR